MTPQPHMLLQYRIDNIQSSTVLCERHRGETFAALQELGAPCIYMFAPSDATCDGCKTELL